MTCRDAVPLAVDWGACAGAQAVEQDGAKFEGARTPRSASPQPPAALLPFCAPLVNCARAACATDVGFYSDTCDGEGKNCLVTELNEENFWAFPKSHPGIDTFLLEFYTPWCTHCQEHAKDVKNAALRLEGKVKFAAINCEGTPHARRHLSPPPL